MVAVDADAVDADADVDADALAAVLLLVAEAAAATVAAVVIGLRRRCSAVDALTVSVGFSLGCLRNRCSRLLQLSDNNCVTLVVDERAYRYVGRRTVAAVGVAAAAAAATRGAAAVADASRRATPAVPAAVDDADDEYAMRTRPIQRTSRPTSTATATSRRA